MSEITDKMKTYTGTKTLKATPMTKAEYNEYRGWTMPEVEDPTEKVYLVEYPPEEDTVPNHPAHQGYISMSPANVFEKYYTPSETYLDRLRIEDSELTIKMEKLSDALANDTVPENQREILGKQLDAMSAYSQILTVRIANAG